MKPRLLPALALLTICRLAPADGPLLVRAKSFLVPPSTGPVTHVVVKNASDAAYTGTLRVEWPVGWRVTPDEHAVDLQPDETGEYPFTIEAASDHAASRYPVTITVGDAVTVAQTVACHSAPYYKPTIDGDLSEWADSIPITLTTGDAQTVVRTYWSKRRFCVAVEASAEANLGAIQFALSKPPETFGEPNPDRYEFLVASTEGASGVCYLLRRPDGDPALIPQTRTLSGLEVEDAEVAAVHTDGVTRYEVSIPFSLLTGIRATPGRELCFSLLVHDPDGTGIRDLGEVMNLWPEHRRADGWCSWEHVKWGDQPPYGSAIEFGLCSSIH